MKNIPTGNWELRHWIMSLYTKKSQFGKCKPPLENMIQTPFGGHGQEANGKRLPI